MGFAIVGAIAAYAVAIVLIILGAGWFWALAALMVVGSVTAILLAARSVWLVDRHPGHHSRAHETRGETAQRTVN